MKVKFFKNCCMRVHFLKFPIGIWVTSQHKSHSHIPKDVPKGHIVVYVGEDCKRFVIKVSTLKYPPFMALLDHAEDVFGFCNGSKLVIPCNENIFLNILRNIGGPV
ncbi:unnamed protein product [Lathyrus sativus]|nr:unnamed protein product [Lathyrus sativus]